MSGRLRYLKRLMRRGCQHEHLVDINTFEDTVRLQGKARVHLCNDCGEKIEVKA